VNQEGTAGRLSSLLSLDRPPVALAFLNDPPTDLEVTTRAAPSSCAFWVEGERGLFFAPAEAHHNCAVGAMVMGFELPDDVQQTLGGLVQSMCDLNYLTVDEAAKIPSMQRSSAGIVYGPLAEFPLAPDAVLLWLTPAQTMLFNEAAGNAQWTGTLAEVSGRPACAALPLAIDGERPRMSLGCMGMRTFTEIPEDRLLAVLPGAKLGHFVDALERTVTANQQMEEFYRGHKAQFA
jgi:uncharacterized protein (DUF169 family)